MLPIAAARKVWEQDLRDLCPVDAAVEVQWLADPPVDQGVEANGTCQSCLLSCDTVLFIIQVWKGLERAVQCEHLAHEWAHALSWDKDPEGQDHGYRWGLAYRKCYQATMAL